MTNLTKWLLGILLFVVLIFGGVLLWQKMNPKVANIPSSSNTEISTANWKTYTSANLGYVVKYPADYFAKEWVDTIKSGAPAGSNKELLSAVGFGQNANLYDSEISVYVYNDTLERQRTLSCWGADSNETVVTVADMRAYQKICKQPGQSEEIPDTKHRGGEKIISIVFEYNGNVFNLSYDQSDLTKDTSDIFNEMVKTFEFNDDNSTADWKIYENKTYGISFKYPSWKLTESTTWPNVALAISLDDVNNLPKADTGQPNLVRIEIYNAISKLDTKNLGATTLKDYLDKYSALSDPVYKNVKSIKIGNKNGYQAEAGPNQYGGGFYYFVLEGDNIFKIWFFDSSTSYSKETSDKFLSTFKFNGSE